VYAPAGGRDNDTLKKPQKPTYVGDDGRLGGEASESSEYSWWNPAGWFTSGCAAPEPQKPIEAEPTDARTPMIVDPPPVEMSTDDLRAKRLARFG
jgi:hypothetical protein